MFLCFAAGATAQSTTPQPKPSTSDQPAGARAQQVVVDEAITAALEQWLESADTPGVAAAIVHRDGPTRVAAAGLRKSGSEVRFQPSDKVHIGSCTKAMTAALIGMLVQDGLLDWNSTIADVLPELASQIHPDYGSVTLEQLLCHRSGMPANAKNWWLQKGATVSETRTAIAIDSLQTGPASPPGEKFNYSNLGYMVAGLMAEARTEQTWESLIRERLFQPLGMASAGFGPTGSVRDVDQPWGHAGAKPPLRPVQHDNAPALGPAGRVHCSIADWGQFARMMLGEYPQLLHDSTRERLSIVPEPFRRVGQNYGYGWVVVRRGWAEGPALSHNGSNTYWSAVIWVAPRRGVAYLAATNAATTNAMQQLDQLIQRLIEIDTAK